MDSRNNGVWTATKRAEAYINGAWRNITMAEASLAGAWRKVLDFQDELSLTIDPHFISKLGFTPVLTSQARVATVHGGHGPFTYLWTVDGADGPVTINSPDTATTTFSANLTARTDVTATFRCTVTDANGATATDAIEGNFHFVELDTGTQ